MLLRCCSRVTAVASASEVALVSELNRTTHEALTGKVEANPRFRESGIGGSPTQDASNLAPEPSGRTAEQLRANDLRRLSGQVGRVGGIRYLPYEWASASQPHISCRESRAPSGVVPRKHSFRPGTGRLHALTAVSCLVTPLHYVTRRGSLGVFSHLVRLRVPAASAPAVGRVGRCS